MIETDCSRQSKNQQAKVYRWVYYNKILMRLVNQHSEFQQLRFFTLAGCLEWRQVDHEGFV